MRDCIEVFGICVGSILAIIFYLGLCLSPFIAIGWAIGRGFRGGIKKNGGQ